MRKHIFFIGTLRNGGAERVVSVLASEMAESGEPVEILTYYDRPVFYEISGRVSVTAVETKSGSKNKIKNLFWLRRYLKEHADVVISFLAPFNMLAITAALGTGLPVIVADRNDPARVPARFPVRKMRDWLYRFADHVVLQTEKNKAYFSKKVQEKSTVIFNPVDMKGQTAIALQAKKEKVFVTAGRLMKQKNQKLLIQAFGKIAEKYPDYSLVIYGEGPEREALEAQVKESGLAGYVYLPGNVSDLYERMKTAEVFVLSSDYEGMPNALIEAMCIGLPVISTRVSGTEELIKEEVNGILVDCQNGQQLYEAMEFLIEHPEKRDFYGKENVKLAEELRIDKVTGQWMKIIELVR